MGKCFSIELSIKRKIEQVEESHPSKIVSTRAYEMIDKDTLHLYKISISSIASRDSSSNLTRKDPSVRRGESYQNLRKTYFVDTRS